MAILSVSAARGQVNNWANPVSDRWEAPANWSLGIPPGASQSVVVTNNGYKALGIFPNTPINSPGTMTVQDLTLSAIPGSFNTLLLNYSGTEVPLRVLNQCDVGENGQMLNLYSGLELGALLIKLGQFHQLGGTLAITGPTLLMNGRLMLTNAEAVLGDIRIGGESGYYWFPPFNLYKPGRISVSGGSLTCSDLNIGPGFAVGELFDGSLTAATLTISQASEFNQYGAHARCEISGSVSNFGSLNIFGGRFSAPNLELAGRLQVQNASLQFGLLELNADSDIDFSSTASTVKFERAGSATWNPAAKLRISHWSGSLGGGGGIWFSNNSSGLNPNQLGQIEFFDPNGLLPGLYRARILESGELIPTGRVSVIGWTKYEPSDVTEQYTTAPLGLTNVIRIAARRGRSIALNTDGTVMEWGLQVLAFNSSNVLAGMSNVVAIDGGVGAMALLVDGTAVSWGYYFLSDIPDAVAICAGAMAVVKTDGTPVFLLHGNYPTNWTDLVQIAASRGHILGLKSDGMLLASGFIQYGEQRFEIPPGVSNVVSVASGGDESIALKSDGTVVAWGQYPTPPLSNVTAIAATEDYSIALHSDGTITTWGDGPADFGLSNVVAIAAGDWHSLALLDPVPVEPFSLNSPRMGFDGAVHFDFNGHLGRRYLIERSTNLKDWSFFRLVAGMNRLVAISDSLSPESPQQYYRARLIQ